MADDTYEYDFQQADLFIYAVKERVTVDKPKLVQALNDRESRKNLTSPYDKMVYCLYQVMPLKEAEDVARLFERIVIAGPGQAIASLVSWMQQSYISAFLNIYFSRWITSLSPCQTS